MALRSLFGGGKADCTHLEEIDGSVQPQSAGCQDCLAMGNRFWVALRVCQTCGHVGCCDSTPHRHARRHAEETGHPIIKPLGAGGWLWCYPDNRYL